MRHCRATKVEKYLMAYEALAKKAGAGLFRLGRDGEVTLQTSSGEDKTFWLRGSGTEWRFEVASFPDGTFSSKDCSAPAFLDASGNALKTASSKDKKDLMARRVKKLIVDIFLLACRQYDILDDNHKSFVKKGSTLEMILIEGDILGV